MANGMKLVSPEIVPPLDPEFKPAVLACHAFADEVQASGKGAPLAIALEREEGAVTRYETAVFGPEARREAANNQYAERLVKFLLWQRGGWKMTIGGCPDIAATIKETYGPGGIREFDADLMADVYERPFIVESCELEDMPEASEGARAIGGHLEGCRVGFDLGASDRKASAVIDGEVVFSEEVEWAPKTQSDPQYHWDGVMDSIRRAAEHLPRVDAIGGSAAGIYVNNRALVASLFRGIPQEEFNTKIKDMFIKIGQEWNAPLVVVNDGDVTALAGGMELEDVGILGIAMGSSEAGGYLDMNGHINGWLNELAFCPVDYNPNAAVDEWSQDYGVGAKYFNQQGVARLAPVAGIGAVDGIEAGMGEPEILKVVQELLASGDERAEKILATIGVWLGYAIAHYADFYDMKHVLILGRVTSGRGAEIMMREAERVLRDEFPLLAERIGLHTPDEASKRVGQAIAAASLPEI
jgi:predicted NBD/HSP70 family sugar kinase